LRVREDEKISKIWRRALRVATPPLPVARSGGHRESYPFYHALLRDAPVYQVPGIEVYLVSSWQLIHQVLKNQEDFSANLAGILVIDANGQPALRGRAIVSGNWPAQSP
jgi:hypothetical protein